MQRHSNRSVILFISFVMRYIKRRIDYFEIFEFPGDVVVDSEDGNIQGHRRPKVSFSSINSKIENRNFSVSKYIVYDDEFCFSFFGCLYRDELL